MTKQESMYALILDWECSSRSIHDYCRSIGINYSTFYYWRKKYQQAEKSPSTSASPSDSEGFIRLHPEPSPSPISIPVASPSCIEIRFPSGIEVSLPLDTPLPIIQTLLSH